MNSLKHVAFKDVLYYATLYLLKCFGFFCVTVAQDQKHTAATKFLKIKQGSQSHKSLRKNANGLITLLCPPDNDEVLTWPSLINEAVVVIVVF